MACEILQEIRGLFDSKESKNTRIGKNAGTICHGM
jgi:hypothetical protein